MCSTRITVSLGVIILLLGGTALAQDGDDPPVPPPVQEEPPPETGDDEAEDEDEEDEDEDEEGEDGDDEEGDDEEGDDEEGDDEDGDDEDGDDEDGDDEDGDDEDGDDEEGDDEDAEPAPPPSALRDAVEDVFGAAVHGFTRLQFRGRWSRDASDADLYAYSELRIGDEAADPLSATFSARGTYDLDGEDRDDSDEYVFSSLADTYDHRLNGKLYTAYLTWRPSSGLLERLRVGRQYVHAAETFHVDGARLDTTTLLPEIGLKGTLYGGVPAHIYESSPRGDWLAGLQLSADPWKGTRAKLDYVHVEDDRVLFGEEIDDMAALSLWQQLGPNLELHGRVTHLDTLRDATARATLRLPEEDLLVQLSYFRLLETKREFVTEFDPYFSVLQEQRRYEHGQVRVVKGFGEHLSVEAGAAVRRLAAGEDEGAFNHDTTRFYLSPLMTEWPWEGGSVSLTGEYWDGNQTRIETYGGEFRQDFGKNHSVAVGTDYDLWSRGPLGGDERNHVRTWYLRLRTDLSEDVRLDLRYTRERDDEETYDLLSLSLTFEY